MKRNKIFASLLFVLLTLGVGLFLSQNYEFESMGEVEGVNVSSSLATNEKTMELGNIPMSEGIKKMSFKYTNDSDKVLEFGQLYTSCMCTKAKLIVDGKSSGFAGMKGHKMGLRPIDTQMVLQPGETMELVAEFDPNAHGPEATGPITRTVTLGVKDSDNPLEFEFSGNVTP